MVRTLSLAFVAAALIATTPASPVSAQEQVDAATQSDAEPGPRLPNGEPAPEPDLIADVGGISCATARSVSTPIPLVLALAGLLRRARRRRG